MICFGGARFAHALTGARSIDEYRLTVQPVALGHGLPLLHGLPEPQRLDVVSATAYAAGSVTQKYTAGVSPGVTVPRGLFDDARDVHARGHVRLLKMLPMCEF